MTVAAPGRGWTSPGSVLKKQRRTLLQVDKAYGIGWGSGRRDKIYDGDDGPARTAIGPLTSDVGHPRPEVVAEVDMALLILTLDRAVSWHDRQT